jgi:glucose/arabinose dehydrogenase
LQYPKALTVLPDDSILIVERDGFLTVVLNDGNSIRHGLNLPALYTKGQGGVLDVLVVEDKLLLSYSKGDEEANALAVVLVSFSAEQGVSGFTPVFEVKDKKDTPVHYGGKLLALKSGGFLVTTGDGFDYREQAQMVNSQLGKIIGFKLNGEPLDAPPFFDNPYVYSIGHRNPQGLVYGSDGNVYQHEHGPDGGDELNLITRGNNYGWPVVTLGKDYSGANISPFTEYQGMINPLVNWTPSIAPSSMVLYRQPAPGIPALFPHLEGAFLITSLKAKTLFAVLPQSASDAQHQSKETNSEESNRFIVQPIVEELNTRLRDVEVNSKGEILVITDGENANLIRVAAPSQQ